eukprot:EG_transcript_137
MAAQGKPSTALSPTKARTPNSSKAAPALFSASLNPKTPPKDPTGALRAGRVDLSLLRQMMHGKINEATIRRLHQRAVEEPLMMEALVPVHASVVVVDPVVHQRRADQLRELDVYDFYTTEDEMRRFEKLQETMQAMPALREGTPPRGRTGDGSVRSYKYCRPSELRSLGSSEAVPSPKSKQGTPAYPKGPKPLDGDDLARSVLDRRQQRLRAAEKELGESDDDWLGVPGLESAVAQKAAEKEKYVDALANPVHRDALALMESKNAVRSLAMGNNDLREDLEHQLLTWVAIAEDPLVQDRIQATLQACEAQVAESEAVAEAGEATLHNAQGEVLDNLRQLREAAVSFEQMIGAVRKHTSFVPVIQHHNVFVQTEDTDTHLKPTPRKAPPGKPQRGGQATVLPDGSTVEGALDPSFNEGRIAHMLVKEKQLTQQLCREEVTSSKLRDALKSLRYEMAEKDAELEQLRKELHDAFTGTGFAELLEFNPDMPATPNSGPGRHNLMGMLKQLKDEYRKAQAAHREQVNQLQTENWQLKATVIQKQSIIDSTTRRMEQELHDAEHLMDHIGANVKDYSVRYGILEMRHMEAEREYQERILELQRRMEELDANGRLDDTERNRIRDHLMLEFDKADQMRKEIEFQKYQKDLLYRTQNLKSPADGSTAVDPTLSLLDKNAHSLRSMTQLTVAALEEMAAAPLETLRIQVATTLSSIVQNLHKEVQQNQEHLTMLEGLKDNNTGKRVGRLLREAEVRCKEAGSLVSTASLDHEKPLSPSFPSPLPSAGTFDSSETEANRQAADFTRKCIEDFLKSFGTAIASADDGAERDVQYRVDTAGLAPEAQQLVQPLLAQLAHSFVNVQHYIVKMRMKSRLLAEQARPRRTSTSSASGQAGTPPSSLRGSVLVGGKPALVDIDRRFLGGLHTLKTWARVVRGGLQPQVVAYLKECNMTPNERKVLDHWLRRDEGLRRQSIQLIFQRTVTRVLFAKHASQLAAMINSSFDDHERDYLKTMDSVIRLKYARRLEESVAQCFELEEQWAEVFHTLVRLFTNKYGEAAWEDLLRGQPPRRGKALDKGSQTDPGGLTVPPRPKDHGSETPRKMKSRERPVPDLKPPTRDRLRKQSTDSVEPLSARRQPVPAPDPEPAEPEEWRPDVLPTEADLPKQLREARVLQPLLEEALRCCDGPAEDLASTPLSPSSAPQTAGGPRPKGGRSKAAAGGKRNAPGPTPPTPAQLGRAREAILAQVEGGGKAPLVQTAVAVETVLTEPSAILRILGHEPPPDPRMEMDRVLSTAAGLEVTAVRAMPLWECLRLAVATRVNQTTGRPVEELRRLPFMELFALMAVPEAMGATPKKAAKPSPAPPPTAPTPASPKPKPGLPNTVRQALETPAAKPPEPPKRPVQTPPSNARPVVPPKPAAADPPRPPPKPAATAEAPKATTPPPPRPKPQTPPEPPLEELYEPLDLKADDGAEGAADELLELKKKFRPGQCLSNVLGAVRGLTRRKMEALVERGKEAEQRILAGGPVPPEEMDDKLHLIQALRLRIAMLEDELLRLGLARSRFLALLARQAWPTSMVHLAPDFSLEVRPEAKLQPLVAKMLTGHPGLAALKPGTAASTVHVIPSLEPQGDGLLRLDTALSPRSPTWLGASTSAAVREVVSLEHVLLEDGPDTRSQHGLYTSDPDRGSLEEVFDWRVALEKMVTKMGPAQRSIGTMTDGSGAGAGLPPLGDAFADLRSRLLALKRTPTDEAERQRALHRLLHSVLLEVAPEDLGASQSLRQLTSEADLLRKTGGRPGHLSPTNSSEDSITPWYVSFMEQLAREARSMASGPLSPEGKLPAVRAVAPAAPPRMAVQELTLPSTQPSQKKGLRPFGRPRGPGGP